MFLIAASVSAAFALLYVVSGFIFYRIAIARTPKKFMDEDPAIPEAIRIKDPDLRSWWDSSEKREERARSFDGLELVADYLPTDGDPELAVILLHGYTGTGPSMRRYARLFRERFKCAVLTPDLRGHGRSGGSYIGFGLHDSRDLLVWVNRVAELVGTETPIFLMGVSMGAATALIASGAELPRSVAGIISDCAYSDARAELRHKLRMLYRLPSFPFIGAAELATRILAGYRLRDASPLRAVARATVPILFIHGEADRFVPPSMARALFDAAASRKELFVAAEAGHAESYAATGTAYADRVANFVRPLIHR